MVVLRNVAKKMVSLNNTSSFALKELDLTLPKGYIMGIIGPNGSGKTTLLNIILGLYKADKGSIEVCGRDLVSQESENGLTAADDIGYVLQGDWFSLYLSLEENGKMYGKYYSRYEKSLFMEYLNRFKLDSKKRLKNLSKGERLKFQMAFALAHKPKLLILDEPTATFDPDFRQEFLKLVTEFVADGEHSVIMATHIMEDLDRIADYITFLNKGKLVFSMDRDTLMDSYRLLQAEDYKLNLLPKERVIYKEKGEFGSKALVKHNRYYQYDREVTVSVPSIEDIFYFMVKGGVMEC